MQSLSAERQQLLVRLTTRDRESEGKQAAGLSELQIRYLLPFAFGSGTLLHFSCRSVAG